jgi:hypothetical protein
MFEQTRNTDPIGNTISMAKKIKRPMAQFDGNQCVRTDGYVRTG